MQRKTQNEHLELLFSSLITNNSIDNPPAGEAGRQKFNMQESTPSNHEATDHQFTDQPITDSLTPSLLSKSYHPQSFRSPDYALYS